MQPLPNIDELLTGLLDGNLTEGELRQVEAAMAADSTLEKQLETAKKNAVRIARPSSERSVRGGFRQESDRNG